MHRASSLLSRAAGMAIATAMLLAPPAAMGADTPEGAVDAVLDAYVAKRWEAIGPLVCEAARDDVVGQLDLSLAFGGDGLDPAALIAGIDIAIDGRRVTLVSEDGDTARVAIEGVERKTADETAARAWVVQTLAEIGQSTDDAAVDEYLGYFLDAFREPLDLAATVDVIRVDGRWLLCDDLGGDEPFLDPSTSAPPAADPLCDTMTVDELNAASGLRFVTREALDGGCSWDSDPEAEDYFNLSIYRQEGDLGFVRDVWPDGRSVTIGGRPAWATDFGTWIELESGLLTIMPYLAGPSAEAIGSADLAQRVGEIVVPRLP